MNQVSSVLATLEHYKVAIRDTLEYAIPKEKYDVDLFHEKKRSVLIELDEQTPLKSIITNSGENGEKLEKMIREWYDEVYGESSTIIREADDGLRVDHAQHIAIFKGVLPIHENIEAMVHGIINDASAKKLDVERLAALDLAEERLYRGVCYMTMTNELIKLFNDYNQARREAKGEETAASKFIGNDINEMVNLLNGVRVNNRLLTDEKYMGVQDKVFALIEFMTGRRDLPMGKGFGDAIRETQEAISGYVREVEPAWRELYTPVITELIEQAKANGNKIGGPAPEEAAN